MYSPTVRIKVCPQQSGETGIRLLEELQQVQMPDPTALSVLTFHDKRDNWLELQKSLGLGVCFAFGVYAW